MAYTPRKTALWHEVGYRGGPARQHHLTAGGWHAKEQAFRQVTDYMLFKKTLEYCDNGDGGLQAFLDGFTAAVEAGALFPLVWFRAFRKLADWKKVAADLVTAGPLWISERQRNAFLVISSFAGSLEERRETPALNNLAELGTWLRTVDWRYLEGKCQGMEGTEFPVTKGRSKRVPAPPPEAPAPAPGGSEPTAGLRLVVSR